ncbi:MAG: hypothetical protein E5W25_05805 [Mesorhizobium sp.]|nr:MAG: hypothetical protein E5W25_05805 [Mesorhizobium sp.]
MADQNINNMTVTWNSGGTTFNALKMNVTDTASAAASALLLLQVAGSDKFKVGKDGSVTAAGALSVTGNSTITGNLTITGTLTAGGIAGSMTGPASSTDNAIARFNGTTGTTVQNSGVTIDDSNNLSTAGSISSSSSSNLATISTSASAGTLTLSGVGAAGHSWRILAGASDLRIIDDTGARTPLNITNAGAWTLTGNTTINGTLTVTG